MKKLADNILSWCDKPEDGAIKQAINISKHPWLVGNVCLMPDTHEGYGMPNWCMGTFKIRGSKGNIYLVKKELLAVAICLSR